MPDLIDDWWPVTHDYGLIKAPAKVAAARLCEEFAQHGVDVAMEEREGALSDLMQGLLPLHMPYNKRLFVETDFGWSAYFTNSGAGSDPFPAMSLLARALDVPAMRVCATHEEQLYAGVIWEVYGGASMSQHPTGYVRSLAAANDGGRWIYEAFGTPFDFEDPEAARAPRKKDRFTRALLDRYLEQFGVAPLAEKRLLPGGSARAYLLSRPVDARASTLDLDAAKLKLSR